jgi:ParB family transcriptional regulator, chromosome partitioning protein
MNSHNDSFGAALDDLGDFSALVKPSTKTEHKNDVLAPSAELAINLIDPDPEQPRTVFDSAEHLLLVQSIKTLGLIQAVMVRVHPTLPGRYMLVHGERRLRACTELRMEKIKAELENEQESIDKIHDKQFAENIARADLKPIEIARYIGRKVKAGRKLKDIAQSCGMNQTTAEEYARVWKMPDAFVLSLELEVLADIRTLADAFALYKTYPTEAMRLVTEATVDKPLTRNMVKKLAGKLEADNSSPTKPAPKVDPDQPTTHTITGGMSDTNSSGTLSAEAIAAIVNELKMVFRQAVPEGLLAQLPQEVQKHLRNAESEIEKAVQAI